MRTQIALMRGINVGGRNKLTMKSLVSIMESIGCSNVRTYIQSGNVIFDAPKKNWSKTISQAIEKQIGFAPEVLLLTAKDLKAIADAVPFPIENPKAVHAFFLTSAPKSPDLARIKQLARPTEQFLLGATVFYLYAPEGIGRSKLAAGVEKALGTPVTARNWNTVVKLLDLC